MFSSLKQIEEQARALDAEERAKLAETLLESLHFTSAEFERAWAEEIEQRVVAFDRGEILHMQQRMYSHAEPDRNHDLSRFP